jgi:AcrR family transcriptional regulator
MAQTLSNATEPIPGAPSGRFREKRELILDAAARLFNAQGLKGAGLGEIAASVGLVKSGITYYFRKKEELAAACLLRAIAQAKALALEAAREASTQGRVTRFLVGHAEQLAAIERGEQPALIGFSETRALPDALAAEVFEAYIDLFRCVRRLLPSSEGPRGPALGREARSARAFLLLSMAHALPAWVARCEPEEYPRQARRCADILLHGVMARGQRWPGQAQLLEARLPEPALAGDETAEAFLRAATDLINEQGYRGASVDRIAAVLKATKGKFYHHHDTKDDLVSACFERSFVVQRHFLRAAEVAPGSSAMRVVALAAGMVGFQFSSRGPLLRASAYSALPDAERRDSVHRTMQRLAARLSSLLVDGLLDGSVRPLDTALAADTISATINAVIELRRWLPEVDADSAIDLYLRPGLQGLLCPEAAGSAGR